MCTAIRNGRLFGRTLDLEFSYGEGVVLLPRNAPYRFRFETPADPPLAILGTAYCYGGVPLFYDAMNESGLAAAALNFPGLAVYQPYCKGACNLASFEVIPYLLRSCRTVSAVRERLREVRVTADAVSDELPVTPLHWLIADRDGAITVEPTAEGLRVFENPFGVLTNAPDFRYHTAHLSEFLHLTPDPPENRLLPEFPLPTLSRGMGAIGLPGDFSSQSRFVRAVYAKRHAEGAESTVERFFHVMDTVKVPRGCVRTEEGRAVFTVYTSCMDLEALTYSFTTEACREIRSVSMDRAMPDGDTAITFPMAGKRR